MIDKGANPFVVAYNDDHYTNNYLAESNLSNLPTKKSVYFTIRPLVGEFKDKPDFFDPWFYRNDVFGIFDSVIGQGA